LHRPRHVYADRGTEHGSGPGIHRWVVDCRTGSAACASAGNAATTSTKPSSPSAAPSSSGDDSRPHS